MSGRTFEDNPKLFPCGPYVPTKRDDFFDGIDDDTTYQPYLSGSDLILSGSDGSTSVTSLSSFIDVDTNTTYSQELLGSILTLSGSDGSAVGIDLSQFLDDTVVTYEQTLSGTNLTLSGSNGDISVIDLSQFLDDTDTTVTYEQTLVGTDLTLSGSDGSTNVIDLSQFLDDTVKCYTQLFDPSTGTLSLSGSDGTIVNSDLNTFLDDTVVTYDQSFDPNTGVLTLSGSDGNITTNALSAFFDNVDYVQSLSGNNLMLSSTDGNIQFTDLTQFLDDTVVTYSITSSAAVGGETVITLSGSDGSTQTVTVPYSGDGVITAGTYLPDSSDVITIPVTQLQPSGVTSNIGNVQLDLSGLVPTLFGAFLYNSATNQYVHTAANGSSQNVNITDVDTSVAGQVTFTDPNGDTVTLSTIDQGGFTFDPITNSYVHSSSNGGVQSVPALSANSDGGEVEFLLPNGQIVCAKSCDFETIQSLSGTNLVLSSQDGVQITDLSQFLDDSTVTYVQSLSGNDLTLSGSDGSTNVIDLTQFLDDTVKSYTQIFEPSTGILTLSSDDGVIVNNDLSDFFDNTVVTYATSLSGADFILSGSDGSTQTTDLSPFLDDTDEDTKYVQSLAGNTLTLSGSDGVTTNIDLGQFIDDTILTYTQPLSGNILSLTERVDALEDCVFYAQSRVKIEYDVTNLGSPSTSSVIEVIYGPNLDLSSNPTTVVLGLGFPQDSEGYYVIPTGNYFYGLGSGTTAGWSANRIEQEGGCKSPEIVENTFVTFGIPDANGNVSTTNADGSAGPCLKTCAAPDASISHATVSDANIAPTDASIPDNEDKEEGDTRSLTDATGLITIWKKISGVWTLQRTIPAPSAGDVSTFTVSTDANGIQTATHVAGGITENLVVPVGSTLVWDVQPDGSIDITTTGGDGTSQTNTIPAPPAGAISIITEVVNPDGTRDYSHVDGNGGTPVTWTTQPPAVAAPTLSAPDANGLQTGTNGVSDVNTNADSNVYDSSGNSLTATTSGGALDELALQQQVESSDFAGSAAPTPFDRNVGLEVNAHFGVNTATFGTAPAAGESLRLGNKIQTTGLVSNEITNAELLTGNTITVDAVTGQDARAYSINGDPFTASEHDLFRPYLTLQAADDAREIGETLNVRTGTYTGFSTAKGGGFDFAANSTINSLITLTGGNSETFHVSGKPNITSLTTNNTVDGTYEIGKVLGNVVLSNIEPNSEVNYSSGSIGNNVDITGLQEGTSIEFTAGKISNNITVLASAAAAVNPVDVNIKVGQVRSIFSRGPIGGKIATGNVTGEVVCQSLQGQNIHYEIGNVLARVLMQRQLGSLRMNDVSANGNKALAFTQSNDLKVWGGRAETTGDYDNTLITTGVGFSNIPPWTLQIDNQSRVWLEWDRLRQPNNCPCVYLNNGSYGTIKGAIIESGANQVNLPNLVIGGNYYIGVIQVATNNNILTLQSCSVSNTAGAVICGSNSPASIRVNLHLRDTYFQVPASAGGVFNPLAALGAATILSGTTNIAESIGATTTLPPLD